MFGMVKMADNLKGIDETKRELEREERRQRWIDRRELKRVLLGHTHQNEEGILTADQGAVAFNRFGMEDGAVQVYFLGIMLRRRRYLTDLSPEAFFAAADKACSNIGRRVELEQLPDGKAVFRRYKVSVPVLLQIFIEDGEVVLVGATARALSGFRSMRRIRKSFEAEMGDKLKRIGKDDITPRSSETKNSGRKGKKR